MFSCPAVQWLNIIKCTNWIPIIFPKITAKLHIYFQDRNVLKNDLEGMVP